MSADRASLAALAFCGVFALVTLGPVEAIIACLLGSLVGGLVGAWIDPKQ